MNYGSEEEAAVLRVLRSGWISMGPEVKAFEREIAEFQRTDHAFAVANGTTGLHLALLALGVGPGDEIIQPAMNFVAAANMTVAVGATPVFADIIGLREPTLDPIHVESLITSQTKAVVAMHYGGYLCRMNELSNLCRKHGLYLIEDACHAIGASNDDGVMAGSMADIGVFSFFSNKNLATGEGGMIVTDSEDIADHIRLCRSHGMSTLTWERHQGLVHSYEVSMHGYNYRLDDIHAALGRQQLKKLSAGNRRRHELTNLYRKLVGRARKWGIPFSEQVAPSAYHLMSVVAPDTATRDRAVQKLREGRIQASMHYPCITSFSAYSNYCDAEVPRSHEFAAREITLPLYPGLDDFDVEHVAAAFLRTT